VYSTILSSARNLNLIKKKYQQKDLNGGMETVVKAKLFYLDYNWGRKATEKNSKFW